MSARPVRKSIHTLAWPDGDNARTIRAELGWVVPSVSGIYTFDHLLNEAERRYWHARSSAPQRGVEAVA